MMWIWYLSKAENLRRTDWPSSYLEEKTLKLPAATFKRQAQNNLSAVWRQKLRGAFKLFSGAVWWIFTQIAASLDFAQLFIKEKWKSLSGKTSIS